MNKIETVKQLWERHREFIPDECYPSGIVSVPEAVPGISFFPGGYGLYNGGGRVDSGKRLHELPILILGNDWGNQRDYNRRVKEDSKLLKGTWKPLLRLMKTAGIDPSRCFFTNSYMGLREGRSNTDESPAIGDEAFANRCREFLRLQVQTQQPRIIFTLGLPAAKMLAELSPELAAWRGAKNTFVLNNENALVHSVRFLEVEVPAVAALVHPSYRETNFKRHKNLRSYRGKTNDDAEQTIIRDAIKAAGLSGA